MIEIIFVNGDVTHDDIKNAITRKCIDLTEHLAASGAPIWQVFETRVRIQIPWAEYEFFAELTGEVYVAAVNQTIKWHLDPFCVIIQHYDCVEIYAILTEARQK